MGEMSKQVRVDNWGVFFLQRLQTFFNKTDYCDLTLQFEGNVQLKVHRLVMYACTDYFHVLEQTCEMSGDILIMPPDLQADVIVPIINFMYTGMLEFQLNMFDKLYQTATLMNITILTKLLDAQRKPFIAKAAFKKQTHEKKIPLKPTASNSQLPATLPGRKLPVWKRKIAPIPLITETVSPLLTVKPRSQPLSDPLAIHDSAPKPTRFEWPEEELTNFNPLDSTFDDISYTSRPLLTQEEELKTCPEARKAASRASRSNCSNSSAIDVEDVKDYVKEQRIRMDFEDEESTDNDLMSIESASTKRKLDNVSPTSSTSSSKRVRFNLGEKENKETKVNITTTDKGPVDMDHTKIISELLKKYPDLVKKNKNIRLKIMAKNPNSPEKGANLKQTTVSQVRVQLYPKESPQKVVTVNKDEGPWTCTLCSNSDERVEFVLYYLYRKHMADVHNEKFDSKMCKFCGHKNNKHNMLMYHMYTKHGVKPPPAYNFPKCSQCHYIALTEGLLIKHKLNHAKFELQCKECRVAFNSQFALENHIKITGHSGKYGKKNYVCQYCAKHYQSGANLFSHIKLQHREEAKKDGIVSIDEIEEDAEEIEQEPQQIREEDEYITPELINETKTKEKFKILQNVKVPIVSQQQHANSEQEGQTSQHSVALEPSSEAEALSNVASGIATSLGLVDIVVLNDNQQYILQSNQQLQNNQPEFILPELENTQFSESQTIAANQGEISAEHNVITQSMLNSGDIASTDELVMVLTDHDYGDGNNELITNDNSNIVVLYSHPVDGQENQFIASQGNLMVNSQTGMIEIRNGPAIATSTPNTIVVTQAQDTHIESIEMIQQEINSHANTTHQEEHHDSQQQEANQPDMEDHETPQEFAEQDAPVEIKEAHAQDINQEDVNESVEEVETKPNVIVSEPLQKESLQENEQQQEVQDDSEQTLPPCSLVSENVEPQNEEEKQDESLPQEDQDENTPQEQNEAAPIQETLDEQQSPQITSGDDLNQEEQPDPEETPAPELLPQLTAEPETNDEGAEKELEMPVLEEEPPSFAESQPEEETLPQQEETPKIDFADQSNEASEGQDQSSVTDENSQSSHSSVRQQTTEGGVDEAVQPTKISILDDWDDTDSQTSEHSRGKSGNTVNKLMDDWADEEEDESKRTAN